MSIINPEREKQKNRDDISELLVSHSIFFPDTLYNELAQKAVWRGVFLTIWHRILNADSTKTHSSGVTF